MTSKAKAASAAAKAPAKAATSAQDVKEGETYTETIRIGGPTRLAPQVPGYGLSLPAIAQSRPVQNVHPRAQERDAARAAAVCDVGQGPPQNRAQEIPARWSRHLLHCECCAPAVGALMAAASCRCTPLFRRLTTSSRSTKWSVHIDLSGDFDRVSSVCLARCGARRATRW